MGHKCSESGNALIEFTFVGIPLIFVIISTFEMARGMWIYETLAYAAREGARFASVRGNDYANAAPAKEYRVTVDDVAKYIRYAGVGLAPDDLTITLSATSRPDIVCPAGKCPSSTDCFPAAAACDGSAAPSGVRGMPIEVTLEYRFRSAIAMFWLGAKPVVFGEIPMRASSQEQVHF